MNRKISTVVINPALAARDLKYRDTGRLVLLDDTATVVSVEGSDYYFESPEAAEQFAAV